MMAILGRHKAPCMSCGFDGVHIKCNDGKKPFFHCPNCGLMASAKNGQQAAGLLANMRAQKIDLPAKVPEPPKAENPIIVPPDAAPVAAAAAPAGPRKPAGLFDMIMSKAAS